MAVKTRTFTDAERMELRSHVELAGEAISSYWPMRTFIHHNPLHGLEELPFDQAVKRGEQLLGGKGYLPDALYRRFFEQGRICPEDLTQVLAPLASERRVLFAGREVSHQDVLRLSMVHGLGEALLSQADRSVSAEGNPDELTSWLATVVGQARIGQAEALIPRAPVEVLSHETLSTWCDRTLGTSLVSDINEQMIKWCSAFLDEGEASWTMPDRQLTFYRAWKRLVRYDASLRLLGVADVAPKIDALGDRPEEAVLDSLAVMGIPKSAWESYFALHLSALPGWTGYIKWRSEEQHHPWQARYPVDLVKYLAVRLFYEREFVALHCRRLLGIPGHYDAIRASIEQAPYAHWLRRQLMEEGLPPSFAAQARDWSRLHRTATPDEWNGIGKQLYEQTAGWRASETVKHDVRRLLALSTAMGADPEQIRETALSDVSTVLNWLDGFPAGQQSQRWLEAFEARHRRDVVRQLRGVATQLRESDERVASSGSSRPLAQLVFCIDIRSEVLRRHLEQRGGYETLGVAGFFGIPVKYQAFGEEHPVTHSPVLLKPKNHIREIPRSYHGAAASRHRLFSRLNKAGHELLHDLKENVITPYVMVEALGWFFSVPFFGKTLCPLWYHRVTSWVKRLWLPPLATTLTIDKLTREEAEEMVAAEQRAAIRASLRQEFPALGSAITPALIETIRLRALENQNEQSREVVASALGIASSAADALNERLRRELALTPRGMSTRLQRITLHGFSVAEQAYGVEAALRLMGFTSGFSRLVVMCSHGSTSDNNPYESALDCGACGGNSGLPNARAFAAMANNQAVRKVLESRGLKIPGDTHFVAALHDTTRNDVRIVDLEDVPPTHRKDLVRLLEDLKEAGTQAALERGMALERPAATASRRDPQQRAYRRSVDWAQVRPEWGLSKNNLLIIGRRELTRPLDLQGRSFLHSYDYRQDASGKLLETIMTAPLIVAQWINMEHYFSAVDNEVYGSGSKVYHNIVGRVGVMSGATSDLRLGLPAQTVLDGPVPYHEPMRLLAVIEAPRVRVESVIAKHPGLERLFQNEWVSLVVCEPNEAAFYHYDIMRGWQSVSEELEMHPDIRGHSDGHPAAESGVRPEAGGAVRERAE
ncbi:MAG: DUF2309 domain-containing protein [Nitrospira sp.]|jgi:uncharacterized protein YbcC (UPF0753/DUF2309 family)|nr:DUF2309 domain-containing protein [Nitrospira sp.]